MSKVQLYLDEGGEWRWRRVADNGQIVSTSGEGYIHKSHAKSMAMNLNPDVHVVEEDGS